MKKIFLIMAVLSIAAVSHAENLDGSWMDTACYGCPGDTVITEVKASISAMKVAEDAIEADRTIENLQAGIDASLFSYLKAEHELEIGDIYLAKGDTANAKASYAKTLEYANTAVAVKDNGTKVSSGDSLADVSHTKGKKVLGWLSSTKRKI